MKAPKKPRPKTPKFVAPAFRLRAITLALLATAAGVLALVIALTPAERPNFLVPRPSADPPWPEGFVEWDPEAWGSSPGANAAPASSAGATSATQPGSPSAGPSPSLATASARMSPAPSAGR